MYRLNSEFEVTMYDYTVSNSDEVELIAEEISEEYGEKIKVTTLGDIMKSVKTISDLSGVIVLIVYIISIIFVLVVAYMVCSKVFFRERKDFGIYKAFGFTSTNLRMQFVLRFLIVAVIGSTIGTILSVIFSKKVIGLVLKMMGITNFNANYSVMGIVGPILLLSLGFGLSSLIISRKIKKVNTRMLIVE
ncbi:ABC transporter permease [Sedimentibacter sp. zth1]|uniref:FtsX-like permease family protein n=1 Tax=Sedimentibacter sp. zth1 TaxID=2816908 RepID=UPI001A92A666|nr:ABC transporter permease [Sedimentibacter sp. zth1]QSX05725.1 ABC transporter permease [Sedimentibacter sp. zth1]